MAIYRIDALSPDGRGIIRRGDQEKIIFVSGALPGDTADIALEREHKNFCEARTLSIVQPAPGTIEPACPHAGLCGGCALMRLPYAAQLEAKQGFVHEALTRTGKIASPPLLPILASPASSACRNRVQLAFAREEGRIRPGMRMAKSHSVVPAKNCLQLSQAMGDLVSTVEELVNAAGFTVYTPPKEERRARSRQAKAAGSAGFLRFCQLRSGLVPDADSLKSAHVLPEKRAFWLIFLTSPGSRQERDALARLATDILLSCPNVHAVLHEERASQDMLVRGEKRIFAMGRPDCSADPALMLMPLLGKGFLTDAADFFQVNEQAADLLAAHAADLVTDAPLLDLYCGAGAPGLLMRADYAAGIEYSASSIAMARKNALRLGKTATFYAGDAARVLQSHELRSLAVSQVLCDPPRAGMDPKVISWLAAHRPARIVYISCNPVTLARDIRALQPAYTLTSAQPLDMFPQTPHVETICLLSRC